MRKFTSLLAVALSGCVIASAADIKNPLLASSSAFYAQVKDDVLRSAEKMPEESYSFKPAPDVRTFGELLAHVADAQFLLCGIASGGKPTMKSNEKTAKTKAEIVTALKDGFAFCDAQYAKLSDQDAAAIVSWFGQPRTKLGVLDFNTAHAFEHYGNMVTYMRIKGIVPPSSEKRGQ
jgi:uncharacterized damage-inducible protein DinB